MEYVQSETFQYHKETNKATTREKFESLDELLDFLHNDSEDDEIVEIVRSWLDKKQPKEVEPIRHQSGESPINFINRHGYELTCYDCLRISRKYEGTGEGRRCVEDFNAATARDLATLLGWYQ